MHTRKEASVRGLASQHGRRSRESEQGGFVIVTVAVLLVVLLSFSALAIDVGILYSARASAQRAADAAALAGAFTFVVQPQEPQPATAESHALELATDNSVLGDPILASEVTIEVDVPNQRVRVVIERTEATYFARLFSTGADIAVEAVAEAATTATCGSCVKPWFIPNTVLSTQAACAACGAGEVLISGNAVTPFAQSQIGTQFRVRSQNPGNSLAPGQFYAIQVGGPGGANYRDAIGACAPQTIACRSLYSVETGNMVGPTVQGVRDLIGNPPRDTYDEETGFFWVNGALRDTSRALVIAPIWNVCDMPGFCPSGQFPSGTNVNLEVVGFALIFLEGIQGNDVVARLINVSACGGSAPAACTEGSGSSPFGVPVRLVRMP